MDNTFPPSLSFASNALIAETKRAIQQHRAFLHDSRESIQQTCTAVAASNRLVAEAAALLELIREEEDG